MAAKKKTDAATEAPEAAATDIAAASEAAPEPATVPPPPPDPNRFDVEPRLVDHVVFVDVKRGGELIGTITTELSMGFNGVYVGMHETKDAFAAILRKVHDDAYYAGLAAAGLAVPTKPEVTSP